MCLLQSHNIFRILLLVLMAGAVSSCQNKELEQKFSEAENLVFADPDSCIRLLETVEPYCHYRTLPQNDEYAARWALFHVWGQYRAYKDDAIDSLELETAFDYYKESSNALQRARANYLHSSICQSKKVGSPVEWDKEMYSACLAVSETDDYQLAARIYQVYATKCGQRLDYDEQVKWDELFLDATQKTNRLSDQILAMVNLATGLMFVEDQEAKKKAGSHDGATVAQFADFGKPYRLFHEAEQLAEEKGTRLDQSRVYSKLSHLYSRMQVGDSALMYAQKAVAIQERLTAEGKMHNPIDYLYVADAYRKLGVADSALYYAEIEARHTSLVCRSNASNLLFQIYHELLHDYEKAVEYQHLYALQLDSLHSQDKDRVAAQYEKDNEVRQQQRDKEETNDYLIMVIIAVIAIAVIARILISRANYRKKLRLLEDEMNAKLAERRFAPEESSKPEAPSEITFTGTTKECLTIPSDSLMYVASESNYLKVVYHVAEKVQSKQIRMTMTQAEELLSDYGNIIRCHRAFIVNIDQAEHFSSNNGSFLLRLRDTSMNIPVSKTYLPVVRAKVNTH